MAAEKKKMPIRLDLSVADHKRARRLVKKNDETLARYARRAFLERLTADEQAMQTANQPEEATS